MTVKTWKCLNLENYPMSHMQPEIREDNWYKVETKHGTEMVCSDFVTLTLPVGKTLVAGDKGFRKAVDRLQDFVSSPDITEVTCVHGFGARLSAPGFMDCTDWTVFDTEEKAKVYIRDAWDICPECGAEISEDSHETCETD
jgi:hypothetical protein